MQFVWEFPFFVCTAADPWDRSKEPDRKVRVSHPDADYLSDRDYGGGEYCESYKCPHCGKVFEVELPQ
jgi:hypothetical protein